MRCVWIGKLALKQQCPILELRRASATSQASENGSKRGAWGDVHGPEPAPCRDSLQRLSCSGSGPQTHVKTALWLAKSPPGSVPFLWHQYIL